VILFCAALGDAFSGPSAALLTAEVPEVHPIILSVWRFTITGLIFLPFFLLQLVQGDAIAKQVRVVLLLVVSLLIQFA
jgi:ACR3 family arsenite efflux pump ArsB